MDNDEVEFIAENQLITITPNFKNKELYLISGNIGPFEAGVPCQVPLWLALDFRNRQKCRINSPDWLNVEKLDEIVNAEKTSSLFTQMPNPHYMEIANLLLHCAPEEIPRADEVKALVKDIWDLRMAKLRTSMDAFIKSDSLHAKVNNLTLLEINTVRGILTKTLREMYHIRKFVQSNAD